MAMLRMLSARHGDLAVAWDPADQVTVDAAIAAFEQQLADNRWAAAKRVGGVDTAIRAGEFDPQADEIVIYPVIQGGAR